jgi:hypothetical protein
MLTGSPVLGNQLPQRAGDFSERDIRSEAESRLQNRACWQGPAVTGTRTCPAPQAVHGHRRGGRQSARPSAPLAARNYARRIV